MFTDFKYATVPLSQIKLDVRNPRIVTQKPLVSQEQVLLYFYEHEDLAEFVKKIATEGKNHGAERPYVIRSSPGYVVIEGNTRIAAYKILTGQLSAPKGYSTSAPSISNSLRMQLEQVDCTIAPSRNSLLPIMASAHFGRGDKVRWSYLGSRKAVYDEWRSGRSIAELARAFAQKRSEIEDFILEYLLYIEALKLNWTENEKAKLLDPSVAFNPPVRFLQSAGHKNAVGIELDKANLKVSFIARDAKRKFRHLIRKLVISPEKNLGATAKYDEVFGDFANSDAELNHKTYRKSNSDFSTVAVDKETGETREPSSTTPQSIFSTGKLFSYQATSNSLLMRQLMKEARKLSPKLYPAASTCLLRSVIEAILKHIIDAQGANRLNKLLSLENCIDICLSGSVKISQDDARILKEFRKSHLDYVNLGVHATVIPNPSRLLSVRDCVDQFVKRNV